MFLTDVFRKPLGCGKPTHPGRLNLEQWAGMWSICEGCIHVAEGWGGNPNPIQQLVVPVIWPSCSLGGVEGAP